MQTNFVLLALTTLAAVFLAFGGPFPLIAAVLTATVTALGGVARFQDYSLKCQQHAASASQFAEVERELLTILNACTPEQQRQRFQDAAAHFDAALSRQPLLPPLQGVKDEKGRPLFSLITEKAINAEKAANLTAMQKLLEPPPLAT